MKTIRPWLHIGKYRDTLNHSLLHSYRIGAMLQLAEHIQHPQIATLYLPVEDGVPLAGDLLQRGVAFIQVAHQQGQNVLVACGAGISRSAAFATAALKEVEGISLLEAITIVRNRHPDGLPHPALWDSLCGYYGEPVPYLTVIRLTQQLNIE
jgi:protein-tyrosine phosphatase